MRTLGQSACIIALLVVSIGCSKSDPMDDVRQKFRLRQDDLNRLRAMAEEDHLVELFLDHERIAPPTISVKRTEEYRTILKRLGVLGVGRERGDLIFIPAVRYGWLIPNITCGYVSIPKGVDAAREKLSGVRLIPLDGEWYEECYSRGRTDVRR